MDRIGFLAVFFIVFVVADASDASSSLSKHRILIREPQNDNTTVPGEGKEGSPVPSLLLPPTVSSSGGNGSDTKPVDDPSKEKVESLQPAKTPKPKVDQGPKVGNPKEKEKEKDNPKEKEKDNPKEKEKDNPNEKEKDNPKEKEKDNPKEKEKDNPKEKEKDNPNEKEKDNPKEKEKEKEKEKDNPKEKESCAGVTKIKTCAVKDVAVACIKSFGSGSKEVTILVQNVGNSTLKATLSANGTSKDLEIPEHQHRQVNITIDLGESTNITLNAGTGECNLHIDLLPPVFPSLKTLATPINGAYFLIVAVLTFGGVWACCLIRKRKERTGGGVPYQELEMGLPESVPATAVETAEGWDEGWDDDWDGENAVKTPGARLGSISVNGLTSRAANKDGWND